MDDSVPIDFSDEDPAATTAGLSLSPFNHDVRPQQTGVAVSKSMDETDAEAVMAEAVVDGLVEDLIANPTEERAETDREAHPVDDSVLMDFSDEDPAATTAGLSLSPFNHDVRPQPAQTGVAVSKSMDETDAEAVMMAEAVVDGPVEDLIEEDPAASTMRLTKPRSCVCAAAYFSAAMCERQRQQLCIIIREKTGCECAIAMMEILPRCVGCSGDLDHEP